MPITNPVLKNPNPQVTDPVGYVGSVLSAIFNIFFVVGILYFCWFIFMAAFHLIDSQGDSKNIENSKKEFQYGAMGLIIMFSVFAILKFVGFILGIKGLENLELAVPLL